MEKYFLELGLKPGVQYTIDEVKSAWRKKALESHPDRGGSDEEFKKVMHAFEMISNPVYRSEFLSQQDSAKKLDLNVRFNTSITFEEAFRGCHLSINFNRTHVDKEGNPIAVEVYDIETIRVRVPVGSFKGLSLVFENKGVTLDTLRGDVELIVSVQPHHKFRADEEGNILSTEKIPLDILLKGGKYDVQTMLGIRNVKINPGTRPGEKIHIKNHGCKGANHIVICDPIYPSQEDLKKESWKGLDVNWGISTELSEQEKQEAEWFKKFRGDL